MVNCFLISWFSHIILNSSNKNSSLQLILETLIFFFSTFSTIWLKASNLLNVTFFVLRKKIQVFLKKLPMKV